MSDVTGGVQLFEKMPVPSLAGYTALSIALLSGALYYSVEISATEEWRGNPNASGSVQDIWISLGGNPGLINEAQRPVVLRSIEIAVFLVTDPLCVWGLVNMAYCVLALFSRLIRHYVFGHLRVSEAQHLKDKFWNFLFYKFIFIFGVINVQSLQQVLNWVGWYSIIGFLLLLSLLCKDRFQYLSLSPSAQTSTHVRLVGLLSFVQLCCSFGVAAAIYTGLRHGIHPFLTMIADVSLLSLNSAYVLARYGLFTVDAKPTENLIENRARCVYYIELTFELILLSVNFVHHIHMLLWTNTMISMASLVISLQLRWDFNEIRRRLSKHRNYLKILRHMMASYPMASYTELEKNCDDCAICWEHMETARKLPCGHLFHNACLRSWLEQDTSCPTCRAVLQSTDASESFFSFLSFSSLQLEAASAAAAASLLRPATSLQVPASPQMTNHLFHFDGSRYFSWLPSVSLEVSHSNLVQPADESNDEVPTAGATQTRSPHGSTAGAEVASEQKSSKTPAIAVPATPVVGPHRTQRSELDVPLTIDDLWSSLEQDSKRFAQITGEAQKFRAIERHSELQRRKKDLVEASRRRFLERSEQSSSS